MGTQASSLSTRHPRRYDVPALLLLSFALLLTGLSLPLITIKQSVLWKHWENHYSVFTGVVSLAHQGDYFLAGVLFFFSMIFPIVKLLALAWVWWIPLAEERRLRLLHGLAILGKWSMLDVFVVAILIVLVKLGPLVEAEPRVGVYFFAAAIVASMLTTVDVSRLARSSLRSSSA